MSDPKQGGSLSGTQIPGVSSGCSFANSFILDMAPEGTSIPGDAGVQRVLPSVPNPHQQPPYQSAGADLAGGADNPTDIPRSAADRVGATAEVVTGKAATSQQPKNTNNFERNRRQFAGRGRDEKITDANRRHGQCQGFWEI